MVGWCLLAVQSKHSQHLQCRQFGTSDDRVPEGEGGSERLKSVEMWLAIETVSEYCLNYT